MVEVTVKFLIEDLYKDDEAQRLVEMWLHEHFIGRTHVANNPETGEQAGSFNVSEDNDTWQVEVQES